MPVHQPQHHYNWGEGVEQAVGTPGERFNPLGEFERAGVPVQEFVVRSDMGCGSTIGPLTSARLGIPTVDVGIPQLAMHSARELCAAAVPDQFTRLVRAALSA